MNLFTRYFRINLLATVVIFILASLAFYFLLWFVSIAQVDEDLKIEQREIETYVQKYNHPPEPISVKDQNTSFALSDIRSKYRKFSTIPSPNPMERENFRQISFTLPVNNQWLLFKVSKSLEGTEHLNQSIIIISLITIVAILLVSLLINRWQLRRLWKPFYNTLSGVEKFRLGEKAIPRFENSQITEFNFLNTTISQFIRDADREYFLLKEFTENASHELQTPLAVVRSTLDVMMQDEKLSEAQSQSLLAAYSAIQKMSKLNQSLLLLNKIENKQFSNIISFDFKTLVQEKMTDWQELWQGRSLSISSSLESASVSMNEQLAEMMISNLFSNAARHTPEGGHIHIKLSAKVFEISNSAADCPLDQEKLFKRFSKVGQTTDHHGLGLSIVKQIADVSGMTISYHFTNGDHVFSVNFKPDTV
ncbi:MAG TPA: HAMP domain-containing sensor histidine kinase [Puia sp.]|jgi:signal transduction histidine kinase|nr:HAMP domain-containing sensor histidine kinase [Puia sp.]